jgi:hypothetical protein
MQDRYVDPRTTVSAFAEDMHSVQAWKMPPEVVEDYGRWYPERGQYRLTRTQKMLRDPRVEALELTLLALEAARFAAPTRSPSSPSTTV